ncbi:cytochrome P450 2J2-like isoform X4 [Brienomyrus brachyistius]|uniref:cytochrome P450 2J2-like isoform X4 n=1 Tax=Brienomyrus brachyistius TaxID=42636 RepID=UPI0020B306C1|nr:cytochrome P450 2J2-like isoform X4 [Brienomyrus brachyistius]
MILHAVLDCLDFRSILLFVLVFLLMADILKNRNPANYPPGPWSLPFLGNIFTDLEPKTMLKLAEKYGNVFSLRKGSEKLVFVAGYKMAKEALVTQGENVVDRPDVPLFTKVFKGIGLIFSNGYMWKKHRRFAGTYFKYFGEGKKMMERSIQQECMFLCQAMEDEQGGYFNPMVVIHNAISNVICTLVFGHRYDYSDAKFQDILRLDNECIYLFSTARAQLYNLWPRLFDYVPGPHQTIFSNYDQIITFVKEEIAKHKKDWDPSDPRDFVDAYFGEMDKMAADSEAGFTMESLVISILDLFEAGTESSATTLRWGLLFMMKYPEIQEKVQAEIDRVIGQARQPCMADRPNMPYTDAVIHEMQRMADILPLGFPKTTSKDSTLGGYLIPKGTSITAILTSVLNDESEWETPNTFNPEHFLDSQGRFRRREAFCPFSAGLRACLGEQLAQMELFLFFTSLLQRFTFSPPPGEVVDIEGVLGFTYFPKPYKTCATLR